MKIALNQSVINLDMKVGSTLTVATPVDQSYSLKNVFVGNKQTIRIITTLSNSTHSINATNVSVVSLKSSTGTDITSSTVFNTSLVDYNSGKAGLVEFSAPSAAGMYFIKTLINNNIVAETQFFMKLYTACVQLEGYRWFVSSNDDANLTIKVSEAQDIGLVDSLAGNSSDSTNTAGSSSFGTVYGMHDCYSDYKTTASGTSSAGNNTANIRVAVIKITNTLNGEDVTTKVANLPNNNTDDNGKVSLRLTKPSGGWDGGTYVVELELRDKNNNTDKGFGAFQVKNMWINIWPKQISGVWKWYFSPTENMTFDVNAYNSTGTWYYYGQNDGVGDNCYLLDVFYQGNGAEWFWPPKQISTSKYTWECTNSISPAKGRFTLNITPSSAFDSGYYMVRVKVNTSAGVGDSGEGWLAIRAYNVYVKTGSSNYYDSWYRGVSDNVSVKVEVTNASSTSWECGWSDCPSGQRVADTLNVSVKLLRYDQWPAKDYSTDKYNVTMSNSTSQNVSTRHINTTSGIVNITLIPNGGTAGTSWGTGYYSAAVTVDGPQGKEIGNYWFEIRSFFANLQTVKPGTLAQAYGYSTGQNITVNVSATNKPNWLGSSSYNVALTNVPVNITSMKLSYWDQTIYQMREIPVVWSPNSTTTANPTINATTTINVTATSDLTPGNWYNLEAIITDSSGNNQTGWASFQIKDFTFSTRTTNWKYNFNNSENITLEAAVCDGDTWWCDFSASSYSGNAVNVSVAKLMKSDSWPYTAVSGWSAEGIQVSSSNNGKGNITIVPTSNLSGGYYSAELSAKYASGSGSAVTSSVWFRIESFKLSGSAVKWEYEMSENASIRITPSSAATLSDVKLDCGYWPGTSYSLSGGTLSANSTSLSAGDNIIMLSPAGSGKWASGYCSGWATVTSGGESQTVYISFSMKAFTLSNH
ncbi:MAG: hypothetical protein HYV78_01985 [Candidatus Wildermuthbacteria bacterium]|nr:hypothetical protein [Candidatus Wildermuthbacteria bacterium]